MATRDKSITLRELIKQLEVLSDGGKKDKMPVCITDDWTPHGYTMIRSIGDVRHYYDGWGKKEYIAINVEP